ncbi:hypothetical protein QCA50_006019 [Cerrena zonata]|uniref:Protein-lysine N-methyltransferase EFM4 n=1 Tax=Cerrena zonata TaxID=2478898 RepID=A0AAW0GN22_9APHY
MSEAPIDPPSSKLGTKAHWDDVYSTEIDNFETIGDEGEIWFGEDSMEKMVDWVVDNIPKDPNPSILEVGSGNGALLFALVEAGFNPDRICGVDYSEHAVSLAKAISSSKDIEGADHVTFAVCDFLSNFPAPLHEVPDASQRNPDVWDLVLDKGTFDAMALMEKDASGGSPSDSYPSRIVQVVKPGGYFLIVSCNFTEDELRKKFEAVGLEFNSRIEFPSFSFGGKSGNVYSGVAFHKPN